MGISGGEWDIILGGRGGGENILGKLGGWEGIGVGGVGWWWVHGLIMPV